MNKYLWKKMQISTLFQDNDDMIISDDQEWSKHNRRRLWEINVLQLCLIPVLNNNIHREWISPTDADTKFEMTTSDIHRWRAVDLRINTNRNRQQHMIARSVHVQIAQRNYRKAGVAREVNRPNLPSAPTRMVFDSRPKCRALRWRRGNRGSDRT